MFSPRVSAQVFQFPPTVLHILYACVGQTPAPPITLIRIGGLWINVYIVSCVSNLCVQVLPAVETLNTSFINFPQPEHLILQKWKRWIKISLLKDREPQSHPNRADSIFFWDAALDFIYKHLIPWFYSLASGVSNWIFQALYFNKAQPAVQHKGLPKPCPSQRYWWSYRSSSESRGHLKYQQHI